MNQPVNIDKLLRFQPPVTRQEVTGRDLALYALSVGVSQDPLDAADLLYTDPLRGPLPMPASVLILAHPGFWMADPESGVDPKAVLHAGQSFEIHHPIPSSGLVESRTRVTGVTDKGVGKPALILTETLLYDLTLDRHFATLSRMTYIRGGGGFGGDHGPEPAPYVPAAGGAPDEVIRHQTSETQALFYRLNGDLNPLHSDPALAQSLGFPRPILHGLCTMGIVSHALMKSRTLGGSGALRFMRMRFSRPVFPGETLETEIWKDGRFRARILGRDELAAENGEARFGAFDRTGGKE